MPNKPKPDNRAHTIRVSDDLWAKAVARAEERGESISEAVRRFLERYVRWEGLEDQRPETDVTTRVEWRVETDQTEDDFGTDEQAARDWLARTERNPDWMPAMLLRREVTVITTPWQSASPRVFPPG